MESIKDFLHLIGSVEGITELVRWGGLVVLVAIVFAETGLLVGFFLPGDSLLFTAGFLAGTTDTLQLWQLLVFLSLASIAGDSTGYWIGRKAGQALYARKQSRWFRRDHLLRTKAFYERYGGFAIVVARFMPVVRAFAATVAGVAEMPYLRFLSFSVVGGTGWVCSMTLMGYYFGQIPWVQQNLEKVVLGIIFMSFVPVVMHAVRSRNQAPPIEP